MAIKRKLEKKKRVTYVERFLTYAKITLIMHEKIQLNVLHHLNLYGLC